MVFDPILIFLLISSALVASFGLSTRVPPKSVPTEILGSFGTLPGFTLATVLFIAGFFVDEQIKDFLSQFFEFNYLLLQTIAVGTYVFASGATNLAFWNNRRE